ncbi:ABC transporter permease [Aureibaculum conchae]|uniref:ABC transporter permease n=1 Tax=Aureibaculum sp. 2308TA14-22 TaxID=3108392 RepID=UPI003398EDDB
MRIKLIFRNIWNQRPYSLLNLFGLSLGLSISFIALLYVLEETGYDSFNSKQEQIVRVLEKDMGTNNVGEILNIKKTILFKENIPEIEEVINFSTAYGNIKESTIEGGYYAQTDIVKVLDFNLLEGSFDDFVQNPDKLIISEKFALKHLKSIHVAGQSIILNEGTEQEKSYVIAAVYKNFPKKSSLKPNMIIPIENYWGYKKQVEDFSVARFSCLFLLTKDTDPILISEKMKAVSNDNFPNDDIDFLLQPLTEIHLHSSDYNESLSDSGSINKVIIYASIGGLILLISLANFLLLNTVITERRLKEIAIRKTNGFGKIGVMKMFIGEGLIHSLIASSLALSFMTVILPWFNEFTQSNLSTSFYTNLRFISFSAILLGATGIGSGLYFSNYINKFQVIHVLQNGRVKKSNNFFLKNNAVFIQTAGVVFLLFFSISIYQQIQFMLNSDKGYKEDNLILLPSMRIDITVLKDQVSQSSFIEKVTMGTILPLAGGNAWTDVNLVSNKSTKVTMEMIYGDEDYIPTYKIPLVSGRNFFELQPQAKKRGIIINQTAVKQLRLKDPIGVETNLGTIIGVMNDFKFESFKKPIRPLALTYSKTNGASYIVRYVNGHRDDALDLIVKTVGEHPVGPDYIENYANTVQDKLYGDDLRLSKSIFALTIMAILIALIGILGMVMNKTARMTKEIGIRKVNGAKSEQIVWMLNKSFMKWIVLAFILASPMAYYVVSVWLQNFAYQVSFSVWIFFLLLIMVVGITSAVVSLQSFRVAMANPVEALKDE